MRKTPRIFLATTVLLALAVYAAGAAPVSAPTAVTGPAGALGATTATVVGTINPGGQATNWYVEYGGSSEYGSRTGVRSAGTGATNVDVATALTGLKPGVTYHYRFVATNATGTSYGADAAFTTRDRPAVATGAASEIGPFHATVGGSVDPNGRVRPADGAGQKSRGEGRHAWTGLTEALRRSGARRTWPAEWPAAAPMSTIFLPHFLPVRDIGEGQGPNP